MNDDDQKVSTEATRSGQEQRQPRGRTGALRAAVLVGAVLSVLAAGVASWYGWSWWSAAHDNALDYARTRDDVLRVGQQAVANFNTLDYHDVKTGIDRWQASATGPLLDEITKDRGSYEQQIADAKTVSKAKVVDAAVTELDLHAGTARVIVFVDKTVTPATGQPADKRDRFQGELTRTTSGWKLSAIGQVAIGTAGP